MRLAQLKALSGAHAATLPAVRGTEGQDTAISSPRVAWYQKRWIRFGAIGVAVLIALLIVLARAWVGSAHTVRGERLRIAEVQKAPFVRDVAAQGIVIAAVNPTLFAVAPGTVSYEVRAGDAVKKNQLLATLESPELSNEYQRERTTLDGMNATLSRQEIEIRRQMLRSQQQADLARVAIEAAEREQTSCTPIQWCETSRTSNSTSAPCPTS